MKQTKTSQAPTGTRAVIENQSTGKNNAAALSPPDYGIDFIDSNQELSMTQAAPRRTEAAFDLPDDENLKSEGTNIAWKTADISYSNATYPTEDGEYKAQASVTWPAAGYTSDATNGSSTTVETAFATTYSEVDDAANNAWKLSVASISGGADIHVRTGGSRNAISNPPANEADAQTAVTVMKGYYARGSRGAWHTEDASKNHEKYHYREWRETCNHYWPTCRTAIENLSISKADQANRGLAFADLRRQADAKVTGFKAISRQYWFTLGDGAGDRPYAAGQLSLNTAVRSVQALASTNGWTVAQGTDSPSTANPCYQPWLAYNP